MQTDNNQYRKKSHTRNIKDNTSEYNTEGRNNKYANKERRERVTYREKQRKRARENETNERENITNADRQNELNKEKHM